MFVVLDVRFIVLMRLVDVREAVIGRRVVAVAVVARRELVDVLGSNDCSVPINVDEVGTPMNLLLPRV